MGPPGSQNVDMGSLVRDGDGVGGLSLDFRPTLPVVDIENWERILRKLILTILANNDCKKIS